MGGTGNSPPSSLDRAEADSDGYSIVSGTPGGQHQRRRWQNEKHLAPTCLDMPVFKSTDPNVDVTYMLWRFDVQGSLDQYDETSMRPHIFTGLQGYPSKWVHSLPEGKDISVSDLLDNMDHTFGDTMIQSLYEIKQKDSKTVEEYMLCIFKAVAVICCEYPDWIPDQGGTLQGIGSTMACCLAYGMLLISPWPNPWSGSRSNHPKVRGHMTGHEHPCDRACLRCIA